MTLSDKSSVMSVDMLSPDSKSATSLHPSRLLAKAR